MNEAQQGLAMPRASVLLACTLLSVACGASSGNNDRTRNTMNGATGGTGVGGSSGGSGPSGGGPSAGGSLPSGGDGGAAQAGSAGVGATAGTGASGGKQPDPPPHNVGACDSLAEVGEWENVTPPEVMAEIEAGQAEFGTFAVAPDPQNSGTLFLGTCTAGIWKTTDCGANWVKTNSGKNGSVLDTGSNWAVAVDPYDSDVVYTVNGYGSPNGAFKSTNGGVDWDVMWPPKDGSLADAVDYNFVGQIAMDPLDHTHLLLGWHSECNAPHTSACIGESHDAGETWQIIDGEPGWAGGEGQVIFFLEGGDSWLWESQSNGIWRTTNGGDSFEEVAGDVTGHGAGQLYRASDGSYYQSVNAGVLHSEDGSAWELIWANGPMAGLTGDGTTLYASVGFPWTSHEGYQPFYKSPESDGESWTSFPSPSLGNSGMLLYDPDHAVLYSANYWEGVYRVVVK